ncbi:MAG TPA: hypothetical protein VMJ70_15860 [Candidatus Sulfotelmatobacter sp.]|nr:hypothetical protein [Candidatus Sulfotelmatobacter sp.]
MPILPSSSAARRRLWIAALALIAAAVIPTVVVKRLDGDNRFCISCHLHGQIYRDMTEAPARTLSAAHFRAHHGNHPERCFTCHSGEGLAGWSQVTLLSAWDAARWVAGDRHEPTSMRLPLTNSACLKCHEKDVHGTKSSEETDEYHQLSDHLGVKLPCFSCHQVHRAGPSDRHYLDNVSVRAQCQRCHRDLDAGGTEG